MIVLREISEMRCTIKHQIEDFPYSLWSPWKTMITGLSLSLSLLLCPPTLNPVTLYFQIKLQSFIQLLKNVRHLIVERLLQMKMASREPFLRDQSLLLRTFGVFFSCSLCLIDSHEDCLLHLEDESRLGHPNGSSMELKKKKKKKRNKLFSLWSWPDERRAYLGWLSRSSGSTFIRILSDEKFLNTLPVVVSIDSQAFRVGRKRSWADLHSGERKI